MASASSNGCNRVNRASDERTPDDRNLECLSAPSCSWLENPLRTLNALRTLQVRILDAIACLEQHPFLGSLLILDDVLEPLLKRYRCVEGPFVSALSTTNGWRDQRNDFSRRSNDASNITTNSPRMFRDEEDPSLYGANASAARNGRQNAAIGADSAESDSIASYTSYESTIQNFLRESDPIIRKAEKKITHAHGIPFISKFHQHLVSNYVHRMAPSVLTFIINILFENENVASAEMDCIKSCVQFLQERRLLLNEKKIKGLRTRYLLQIDNELWIIRHVQCVLLNLLIHERNLPQLRRRPVDADDVESNVEVGNMTVSRNADVEDRKTWADFERNSQEIPQVQTTRQLEVCPEPLVQLVPDLRNCSPNNRYSRNKNMTTTNVSGQQPDLSDITEYSHSVQSHPCPQSLPVQCNLSQRASRASTDQQNLVTRNGRDGANGLEGSNINNEWNEAGDPIIRSLQGGLDCDRLPNVSALNNNCQRRQEAKRVQEPRQYQMQSSGCNNRARYIPLANIHPVSNGTNYSPIINNEYSLNHHGYYDREGYLRYHVSPAQTQPNYGSAQTATNINAAAGTVPLSACSNGMSYLYPWNCNPVSSCQRPGQIPVVPEVRSHTQILDILSTLNRNVQVLMDISHRNQMVLAEQNGSIRSMGENVQSLRQEVYDLRESVASWSNVAGYQFHQRFEDRVYDGPTYRNNAYPNNNRFADLYRNTQLADSSSTAFTRPSHPRMNILSRPEDYNGTETEDGNDNPGIVDEQFSDSDERMMQELRQFFDLNDIVPGAVNGGNSMLNNQVPPGTRANNYWDNFKSYSRQNMLSSSSSKRNIQVNQISHSEPDPRTLSLDELVSNPMPGPSVRDYSRRDPHPVSGPGSKKSSLQGSFVENIGLKQRNREKKIHQSGSCRSSSSITLQGDGLNPPTNLVVANKIDSYSPDQEPSTSGSNTFDIWMPTVQGSKPSEQFVNCNHDQVLNDEPHNMSNFANGAEQRSPSPLSSLEMDLMPIGLNDPVARNPLTLELDVELHSTNATLNGMPSNGVLNNLSQPSPSRIRLIDSLSTSPDLVSGIELQDRIGNLNLDSMNNLTNTDDEVLEDNEVQDLGCEENAREACCRKER